MKSTLRTFQRSYLRIEELESRRLLSGFQPTAAEQILLEQLNDIRANPAAYGASIGVDLSGVAPSQPLAFDPILIQAALLHAQDMNTRGYFDHNTPEAIDPGQRLTNAGFLWTSWGESLAGGSAYPNSASALSALILDAGIADLGHRHHLLATDAVFQTQNAVGIGIVQNGSGPLTNYYVIDTAAAVTSNLPILTGSVFKDANGNGRYDIGEGLANVQLTVTGDTNSFTTVSFDSGGYSIALNPGTYTVTASGGGLTTPISQVVTISTGNFRLGFAVPSASVNPDANAWISQLYADILGRTASSGDVAGWVNAYNSGTAPSAIVHGFLTSAEYSQDLVRQRFNQYLHRNPDPRALVSSRRNCRAMSPKPRFAVPSWHLLNTSASTAVLPQTLSRAFTRMFSAERRQGMKPRAGSSRQIQGIDLESLKAFSLALSSRPKRSSSFMPSC